MVPLPPRHHLHTEHMPHHDALDTDHAGGGVPTSDEEVGHDVPERAW